MNKKVNLDLHDPLVRAVIFADSADAHGEASANWSEANPDGRMAEDAEKDRSGYEELVSELLHLGHIMAVANYDDPLGEPDFIWTPAGRAANEERLRVQREGEVQGDTRLT